MWVREPAPSTASSIAIRCEYCADAYWWLVWLEDLDARADFVRRVSSRRGMRRRTQSIEDLFAEHGHVTGTHRDDDVAGVSQRRHLLRCL